MFFRAALFILIFALAAQGAAAQEKPKEYRPYTPPGQRESLHGKDITALPYYNLLARRALEERPENFPFGIFRGRYALKSDYDPTAKASLERILSDAYLVQNSDDPGERAMALQDYNQILFDHLANIDVVAQALSLARQDFRFGDEKILSWVHAGLLQSVLQSGNGETLNGAYDALTMGEEAALLGALGVRVLDTQARESGGVYYNMHRVHDPAKKAEYTIFVDISQPMRFLNQR